MEKYSAFRDPGTGIQPFLTPVPPLGSDATTKVLLPFAYIIGIVRTALILVLALAYVVLVHGVCLVLRPVPPLYRLLTGALTSLLARLALLLIGLWWIPVEQVSRRRGRGARNPERWSPHAGDIILSNWASWIEILYLAFRFNPIFVLPVPSALPTTASTLSTPLAHTPGRRTGTGSAALSSPAARVPSARISLAGVRRVGLLSLLRETGAAPSVGADGLESLEDVRRAADRPIVVFPEGVTSNGRGLLRFTDLFPGVATPIKGFKLFLMCVRYDPPTALTPSLTHPIPSALNPLPQLFSLACSLAPLPISIRLLPPSEAPSAPTFILSEVIPATTLGGGGTDGGKDFVTEACAMLIAQLGKMKRVGAGWEDKLAFLDFYGAKRR